MLFDLTKQIVRDIQESVSRLGSEKLDQSQLHSLVQSALRKCNLVSREEFDAQAAVLAKTRAKVEELEKVLNDIQTSVNGQASDK